jgi:signal transduction histidine kinase
VQLCVDDSGPGIPARERERAFERFNRLGQTKVEGVGLGLSIVLSVVELHRARIALLDSPLGGLRAQVLFARALQTSRDTVSATTAPR